MSESAYAFQESSTAFIENGKLVGAVIEVNDGLKIELHAKEGGHTRKVTFPNGSFYEYDSTNPDDDYLQRSDNSRTGGDALPNVMSLYRQFDGMWVGTLGKPGEDGHITHEFANMPGMPKPSDREDRASLSVTSNPDMSGLAVTYYDDALKLTAFKPKPYSPPSASSELTLS